MTDTNGSVSASSLSPNTELSFDWTKFESVSAAVISAVGEFTGGEPTEMPALYSAIDPDALDKLVDSAGGRSARNDLVVEFLYNGVCVRLSTNGNGDVRSERAN